MSRYSHLLSAYQQLKQHPQPTVLATIIETQGSTYQKAGARMLIDQAGNLNGLLGGGCFEQDLVEHAKSVFETGVAKTVFYDMRSAKDAVWGLGMGCNGAVRIFLQLLVATDDFNPLNLLDQAAQSHQQGLLVTICESAHADFPAAYSLFQANAVITSGQLLQLPVTPEKSRLHTLSIANHRISAFYDRIQPPRQLLIIGAGADAIPLLHCAKSLEWRVSVVDHRPAYLDQLSLAVADQRLHSLPQQLASQLDLSRFSAVVLMTHNFDYDQRFLQAIASSAINFIGLLGPGHRRERLLQGLTDHGELISQRVFGPVGLDIGAETPAEIALSIMAGIQAYLNGRSGEVLSRKTTATDHAFFAE